MKVGLIKLYARLKLKRMNIEKYIVPFLGVEDNVEDSVLIGSAFIVSPNLLITAGHNIKSDANKSFKSYSIIFEEKFIVLKEPKYIEYEYKLLNKGDCQDLAIFHLDFMFENAFYLQALELEIGQNYRICGYCDDSRKPFRQENNILTIKMPNSSYRNFPDEHTFKARYAEYINCICFDEKIKKGYSGCPVFEENNVIGMIVYGSEIGTIPIHKSIDFGVSALKSEYILNIVNRK